MGIKYNHIVHSRLFAYEYAKLSYEYTSISIHEFCNIFTDPYEDTDILIDEDTDAIVY